jgi:hypothetical protein
LLETLYVFFSGTPKINNLPKSEKILNYESTPIFVSTDKNSFFFSAPLSNPRTSDLHDNQIAGILPDYFSELHPHFPKGPYATSNWLSGNIFACPLPKNASELYGAECSMCRREGGGREAGRGWQEAERVWEDVERGLGETERGWRGG